MTCLPAARSVTRVAVAGIVRGPAATRSRRRQAFDLGAFDPAAVQAVVQRPKTQQQVARNEHVLGRGPVVALRLSQVSAVLAEDFEDAAGLDGRSAGLLSRVPGMRAAVAVRLAGALTRARLRPRAAARVLRPAVPPVPVVPVVAALAGLTVRVPTLGSVAALPGVRRRRAVLDRGTGRQAGARGGLLRPGIMLMRRFRPTVYRPTVIVMALVSQSLWPFLVEGQEKPHWRDTSW